MRATEVLKEMEALGTERNRKIYPRHGVRGPMFGVSYADLGKLKKRIKTDHELALELWKSGNHDARVLATMIADPKDMKARDLDAWAKDLDNYVITDAFAGVVAASPHARKKMEAWIAAKGEWVSSVGWGLAARLAMAPDGPTEEELLAFVPQIEKRVHSAPNRTRYSMLMALISMGIRGSKLREKVVAAAKRIGKVQIDHGETGCKTPDVVAYIEKTAAYQAKKAKAAR